MLFLSLRVYRCGYFGGSGDFCLACGLSIIGECTFSVLLAHFQQAP